MWHSVVKEGDNNSRVFAYHVRTCTALLAVPYYPGGSLYARNPPVQPEVSASRLFACLSCFVCLSHMVLVLLTYTC